MSYILITYGYNQFSLFNIKTSTPTLIDKIKEAIFQSIVQKLQSREKSLQKEIDLSIIEEDKLSKIKQSTEQELQIEEEKYQEALKQLEAKRKKEEMKKKEEEAKSKKGKGKKEEKKNQEKKKGKKEEKKIEDPGIDDKPIKDLKEKLTKLTEDLSTLNNNKIINNDKRSKALHFLGIFTQKYKDRVNIKIDLVDSKGEKVNINSRGDCYANEYLVEKTVYELHSFNPVQPKQEEDNKDAKKGKNKKDDKKKDKEKDKENKDKEGKEGKENKDEKDTKEEQKPIEYVLEPVKIDGYCFRTIQEDQNLEESEKNTKDKKGAKKK